MSFFLFCYRCIGHFDSLFASKGATSSEICKSALDSSTGFSIFRADEGAVTTSGNKISAFSLLLPESYENFDLLFATILSPFSVWMVAPKRKIVQRRMQKKQNQLLKLHKKLSQKTSCVIWCKI
jgi:hypothetical protein